VLFQRRQLLFLLEVFLCLAQLLVAFSRLTQLRSCDYSVIELVMAWSFVCDYGGDIRRSYGGCILYDVNCRILHTVNTVFFLLWWGTTFLIHSLPAPLYSDWSDETTSDMHANNIHFLSCLSLHYSLLSKFPDSRSTIK